MVFIQLRQGDPVQIVQGVLNGSAQLPCDTQTSLANDTALLVVWYKNDLPIYSYDGRAAVTSGNGLKFSSVSPTQRSSHWRLPELQGRAYFRTITEPSALKLDNLRESDAGEYRCRVDFRTSQTRNRRVELQVVVVPMRPIIFDDKGRDVTKFVGPYEEGADMKLTCMVSGGKPRPSVRWWRSETLVESTDSSDGFPNFPQVRANTLLVRSLTRQDHGVTYTCQASNTNLVPPMSATVAVQMYLRPLSVEITNNPQPLSAGRSYEIPCQSVGSRPPVRITWSLGGTDLSTHVQNDTIDGNVSISTLTFTPRREDNGKTLVCTALHPYYHNISATGNPMVGIGMKDFQHAIVLNVYYMPMLNLSLGANMNPDDIEEGDDVYFDCQMDSNPYAYKVVWKHNGQPVVHNPKLGIVAKSNALALQKIRRDQAGNYSCVASNVEGDGSSEAVSLRVMYKPICMPEQKRVYGVARQEIVKIRCDVESLPKPNTFRWAFNNSAESIEVPRTRFTVNLNRSSSTLSYQPLSEMDFGTVLCWAANTAGLQREPCVYHVIAAGRPDPPHNCSMLNQTVDSLEVDCMEGFDGGQTQRFQLEVYDQNTGFLRANLSSLRPTFLIGSLESGVAYAVLVYSANQRGRSEPVQLEGFTLKLAEKQTSAASGFAISTSAVLSSILGIICMILLVVLLVFGASIVRRRFPKLLARRPSAVLVTGGGGAGGRGLGGGGGKDKTTVASRGLVVGNMRDDPPLYDERNPDVVPYDKDLEYKQPLTQQIPMGSASNGIRPGSKPGQIYSESDEDLRRRTSPPRLQSPSGLKNVGLVTSVNSLRSVANDYGGEPPGTFTQMETCRQVTSPLVSPVSSLSVYPSGRPFREVVTVRTPLMGTQQESCV
ncbi:synaptogenesis protein syg-2 [Ctenocephalides felis]|uniref:synaptogenesis protein syg-2 n=1 Tax=Ctenocephalides felis TaxID=7515 RepID=UPI000E6E5632|nr:synaptogenesis protein syg-2 [Ctenocephalides felis]